jgi:hypothetical protein
MTLVFFFILGVLLVLLARETLILIGLLIQLAAQIIVGLFWICVLTIQLGTFIGRKLWVKRPPRVRACAERSVGPGMNPVQLVERNGVYVPMKGEW